MLKKLSPRAGSTRCAACSRTERVSGRRQGSAAARPAAHRRARAPRPRARSDRLRDRFDDRGLAGAVVARQQRDRRGVEAQTIDRRHRGHVEREPLAPAPGVAAHRQHVRAAPEPANVMSARHKRTVASGWPAGATGGEVDLVAPALREERASPLRWPRRSLRPREDPLFEECRAAADGRCTTWRPTPCRRLTGPPRALHRAHAAGAPTPSRRRRAQRDRGRS